MIVKQYKLIGQSGKYEWVQDITNVCEDKVYVEMIMDLPYEAPNYKYEAGEMIGDTFNAQYSWCSENANIFDPGPFGDVPGESGQN